MTHYRTTYRTLAAAALKSAPALAGFRQIDAWAQGIDPSQLPCFGIATPSETSSRSASEGVDRQTTIQIAAKISGAADQLEAALDDLSAEIEAVVIGALDISAAHIVSLASTSTTISAEGQKRTGTLVLEFSAIRFE